VSAPPYMKLYVGDYLADTTHLTCLEHGAYMLLLMGMWRANGRLPSDDAKLAKLARLSPKEWQSVRPSVIAFFTRRGGILTHKRLMLEMAKYRDSLVHASKAGKASAAKKRNENSGKSPKSVQRKSNQPEPEPVGSKEGLIESPSTTYSASDAARLDGAAPPTLRVVEREPLEDRQALAAEVLSSMKIRRKK
jgi:uncharacterized protein YdaU (DUF1376 family)